MKNVNRLSKRMIALMAVLMCGSSPLYAGGRDGGGGYGIGDVILDGHSIEQYMQGFSFRPMLTAWIYRLDARSEFGGSFGDTKRQQNLESATDKLRTYGVEKAIEDSQSIPFEFKDMCFDPIRNKRVHSYADINNRFICVDSNYLSELKISSVRADTIVGGLVFHELTHFWLTTEDEAEAAQEFMSFYGISASSLLSVKLDSIKALLALRLAVNDSLQAIKLGKPSPEVCSYLPTSEQEIADKVMYAGETTGNMIRPISELVSAFGVDNLIQITRASICFPPQLIRKAILEFFEGKSLRTINGVRIYNPLQNVRKTNQTNLIEALKQIDRMLLNIRKSSVKGDCTLERSNNNFNETCTI